MTFLTIEYFVKKQLETSLGYRGLIDYLPLVAVFYDVPVAPPTSYGELTCDAETFSGCGCVALIDLTSLSTWLSKSYFFSFFVGLPSLSPFVFPYCE